MHDDDSLLEFIKSTLSEKWEQALNTYQVTNSVHGNGTFAQFTKDGIASLNFFFVSYPLLASTTGSNTDNHNYPLTSPKKTIKRTKLTTISNNEDEEKTAQTEVLASTLQNPRKRAQSDNGPESKRVKTNFRTLSGTEMTKSDENESLSDESEKNEEVEVIDDSQLDIFADRGTLIFFLYPI